jgi:hypothetical protein
LVVLLSLVVLGTDQSDADGIELELAYFDWNVAVFDD